MSNIEQYVKTHEYQTEFQAPCTLLLDQASNVGWSLWDNNNEMIQSGILSRKEQRIEAHADLLVEFVKHMAETYDVTTVLYEEVFIPRDGNPGSVAAVERLYYIKHKITDLGYHTPLQVFGLDNGTWKKLLRDGKKKLPNVTDKEEVELLVKEKFPDYEEFAEDETDAVGMGIAVMANNNGAFYDVSRYNKRLPVYVGIAPLDFEGFKEDGKLYKRFQDAKDAGGLYEIKLKKTGQVETEFKKMLTHKDVLAYCVIPKDYKYWGVYLLKENIPIENVKKPSQSTYMTKEGKRLCDYEEGSYILYAARKKRL